MRADNQDSHCKAAQHVCTRHDQEHEVVQDEHAVSEGHQAAHRPDRPRREGLSDRRRRRMEPRSLQQRNVVRCDEQAGSQVCPLKREGRKRPGQVGQNLDSHVSMPVFFVGREREPVPGRLDLANSAVSSKVSPRAASGKQLRPRRHFSSSRVRENALRRRLVSQRGPLAVASGTHDRPQRIGLRPSPIQTPDVPRGTGRQVPQAGVRRNQPSKRTAERLDRTSSVRSNFDEDALIPGGIPAPA